MGKSKSRRPQDQPQSKLRIKARRERVVQLCAKDGKSTREASAILKREGFGKGSSQPVVVRDLQALSQQFSDRIPEEREKAYSKLSGWLDQLENDPNLRSHERIREAANIYDRLERLLGLAAPTKSISAKVDATVDQGQYSRFVSAIAGLSEDAVNSVFEFARSLPRPKTLQAAPPETSELWEEQQ
jgi:hypothetical protein